MIAEKEFFKISEAKSEKEITIKISESKLADQIKSPNLLEFVTSKIAKFSGIKIKKAVRRNPIK